MIHSQTSPIQSLLRVLPMWGLLGSLSVPGWAHPTGLQEVGSRHERLISLRILPPQPTLWSADATQRFLVLGQYADGLEREVTSRTTLSVSNTRIVTLSGKGQLRGRVDGTACESRCGWPDQPKTRVGVFNRRSAASSPAEAATTANATAE